MVLVDPRTFDQLFERSCRAVRLRRAAQIEGLHSLLLGVEASV
jgi:hypothetical protein